MKAISYKVPLSANKAFDIRKDVLPHFHNSWHFHEELELTLILKSHGRRFIGDHIDRFHEGDLVLLGQNLPHLWQNEESYYAPCSNKTVEAVIIHFNPALWGDFFWDLEEIKIIKKLFQRSKRGIRLYGKDRKQISPKVERLLDLHGFDRFLLFFEILNDLANSKDQQLLASPGFVNSFEAGNDERLDLVYEYVMEHLTDNIELGQVAALLNFSNSAFCRFFKSKTRRTFSYFVKEVRIGYACRLLQNNHLTTSQICYECGFDSFSYFSRSFKQITGMNPTVYRKSFDFRG